jgi:osmotically-inducible protein OsmY
LNQVIRLEIPVMALRAIPAAALALTLAGGTLAAAAQTTPPQLPGAAATATPAMALPSEGTTSLTGTIIQRLAQDPVLGSQTITASVGRGGVVTLNGVVPAQAYADRAAAIVKSIAGVASVNNQILVNRDPFAPPPPEENTALPIAPAPPSVPAAGDPTAKIADALAKVPALANVSAQVYDKKIILYGSVTTDAARRQAEQIVRSIEPALPLVDVIWKDAHPRAGPPLIPQNN